MLFSQTQQSCEQASCPLPPTIVTRLYRKIGISKNGNSFISVKDMHCLYTSFEIFVVTFRVTNFLPKLIDMHLFSTKKLNIHFWFSPIFRLCLVTINFPVLSRQVSQVSDLSLSEIVVSFQKANPPGSAPYDKSLDLIYTSCRHSFLRRKKATDKGI